MPYTLGLDYGTNSVRAILVDVKDGRKVGESVLEYPSGEQGILLDPADHHLARQNPNDYVVGLETTARGALAQAGVAPEEVIGIGIDTTGSSVIPVNDKLQPIANQPEFKGNLSAQCWLWKDHTSHEEATKITEIARKERPQYVAKCGNTYSSEWFWAKIWHCLNVSPDVFDAAHAWVEAADWLPALLVGETDSTKVKAGVCPAGHKALYADEWGGLPDKEFLAMLDPKLADLRDRLYEKAYNAATPAGMLCEEWATRLGLKAGIPVTVGEFDVHYGAIGAGVTDGVLVKAIGTSTCDCTVVSKDKGVGDIAGICGIVDGAILPDHLGIEAGQSAVGDIFKWWVEVVLEGDAALHQKLTDEATAMKPGQSGLLALDWNNGNRTILVDQRLTGTILGCTLHTSRAEIYRALIEGTAFGARMIIDHLCNNGLDIQRVVCCGGIAEKNSLLMQIYADIIGRPMQISKSDQTCALGSALAAAVIAGSAAGGYDDFATAQAAMTGVKELEYHPNPEASKVYDQLFGLYKELHDSLGGVNKTADLGHVMKDLLAIKEAQSRA